EQADIPRVPVGGIGQHMGDAPLAAQDIGGAVQGPGGLLDGAADQIGGGAVPEGGGGEGAAALTGGVQQGGGGGVQPIRVHLAADRPVQRFQQGALRLAEAGSGGEPSLRRTAGEVPLPPQG